jgi:hypothetical protein
LATREAFSSIHSGSIGSGRRAAAAVTAPMGAKAA